MVLLLQHLWRHRPMLLVLRLGARVGLGAVGGLKAGLAHHVVHGELGGAIDIMLGRRVCLASHWHVHLNASRR